MDFDTLQQHVSKARTDSQFFDTLAANPERVIEEFENVDGKVKSAMVAVTPGTPATGLHKYGVYEACTSTSCGCGGSI